MSRADDLHSRGTSLPAADGPVVVARAPSRRRARHLALVLQAREIPHAQVEQQGEVAFLVAPEHAERAAAELAAYERENHGWPPRVAVPEVVSEGSLGALLWAGALSIAFLLQSENAFGLDWVATGRAHAGAMRDGQWYLAVTALTLHSDLAHVAGNIVFGALFLGLACQLLGTGQALLATVASGALGNAVNAWIQTPEHASIGASTAVFGALGLSSAYVWQQRKRLSRWLRFAPLVLGATFLGWLGMSGERTDVLGHACGFVAGLALMTVGIAGFSLDQDERGRTVQTLSGLAALAIVVLAWLAAAR